MAELGVQPPTDLYPKPPQPLSQGALSDPTRLIDLMGAITRNQMLQNELKSRAAVGQAYQDALNPDGTFDPNKLAAGIRGNPDAAWMLPETTSRMLEQQGTQTNVLQKQDAAARALIGTLPPNATDEELRHYAVTGVRAGIPAAVMVGHVNRLLQLKGRQRADAIAVLQGTALGPAGIADQLEGPAGPGGLPQRQGLGSVLRQQAQTGTSPYGQPVGEKESQVAAAEGATALEATGQKTAQIHADLENLRQLNKDIPVQGPTSEFEKRLNQVGARLGIGVTMTADQLRKTEEFDKIANQLSLNQQTMFHGSDQTGRTVVAANPNLGMSRYGREGVIDMLQGNQDALDRMRGIWLASRRAGAPASSFNQFVDRMSKEIDPRVFQFNRISKENQQKFLDDMDPAELPDFERKYRDAISKGWVKPLKSAAAPPAEVPAVTAPTAPPKPGKRSEAAPPAPATPAKSDRATYPRVEYNTREEVGNQSRAEPPVTGARMAADGHWYVRQPHANGEYQRVIMNA